MRKKVLLAMSGGVDSSVSAFLLKNAGYDVVGVTMCFGIETNDNKARCCGAKAIEDAKNVCFKIDIPHYVLDFSKHLEEKVISKFILEYLAGRTPNPCIDCNKFLKFDLLFNQAKVFGCDYLATGHYARIEKNNGNFFLKKAKDKFKDQSYFLYPIKKERLEFIIFPLEDLTKEETKKIAYDLDLPVKDKPQSQDICFVKDKNYYNLILEKTKNFIPGNIVDLNGKVLGRHRGIFFYTIGQREGLGISSSKPLYVIKIDKKNNQIVVGERENLYAKGLIASNLNLFVEDFPKEVFAKIRFRHQEAKCSVYIKDDKTFVEFFEKQEAITPGQSVVFYKDDFVLGGGIIEEVIW